MNSNTIFIIAHWSQSGRVATHLHEFVEYIAPLSKEVIFASTNISAEDENRLSKISTVLKVDNIGYDFWSYKKGFEFIKEKLNETDNLTFMNSSILILDPEFLIKKFNSKKHILQLL